jgi:hypothetical protein
MLSLNVFWSLPGWSARSKYDRIETEEEFHETMDKIADYGIEEEDVSRMKNHSAKFLLNVNFRRKQP